MREIPARPRVRTTRVPVTRWPGGSKRPIFLISGLQLSGTCASQKTLDNDDPVAEVLSLSQSPPKAPAKRHMSNAGSLAVFGRLAYVCELVRVIFTLRAKDAEFSLSDRGCMMKRDHLLSLILVRVGQSVSNRKRARR